MDTSEITPYLRFREHSGIWVGRFTEPEDQWVFSEIVSPSNLHPESLTNITLKTPTSLPKHELNKDKEYANVDMGKPTKNQHYKKENQQLNTAENERIGPLQWRAYQLVMNCQMVSPENIHISSSICTKQVIFRNIIYIQMNINAIIFNE